MWYNSERREVLATPAPPLTASEGISFMTAINDSTTKRCSKCGAEYPATPEYFNRDRQTKCGLHPYCKACMREMRQTPEAIERERKRYLKPERRVYKLQYNKTDKNKQYMREYQQRPEAKAAHRENERERRKRPEVQQYIRDYVRRPEVRERTNAKKRTDEYRAWDRQYSQRPHVKARKKSYAESQHYKQILRARYYSPEGQAAHKAYMHRHKARKRALSNSFTKQDWLRAVEYFGGCCAICGRPPGLWHKLAADHWIPLASADCPGTVPTNIVPLCHGEGGCNNSKNDTNPIVWLEWKFGKRRAKQIEARINAYFEVTASSVRN